MALSKEQANFVNHIEKHLLELVRLTHSSKIGKVKVVCNYTRMVERAFPNDYKPYKAYQVTFGDDTSVCLALIPSVI